MNSLAQILADAERFDLTRFVEREGDRFADLRALRDLRYGDRSLLDHTQAVLDAVLDDPPPALPPGDDPTTAPWWSPMPAVYAASVFQHVGLPVVTGRRPGRGGTTAPHARESAVAARRVLRDLGLPFTLREHAAALILHQDKPLHLPRSCGGEQTYMRLSCALDLRSLYWLRAAEARAWGDDAAAVERLNAFRRQAERLGVFGRPHRPPLDAEQVRALGFEEPAERHRALNALRYFELVARMYERQWCVERLRQESAMPRGRLHLLVGPAGCGKSVWAEEHLADTRIISSDLMREELTGDPADQSQNYLVFQRCMDRVRRLLHEGGDVTFDATNYSRVLREMPVQAARWSGAEIVSYYFDVGLDRALARNTTRHRQVPEHVIRKQHRLLEPPALYEADRQTVVYADGRAEQYWPAT